MSRQPSTLQRTAASVSLSEVSVSYNGTDLAVEDATLTVESGTALVLLGPSGSGKTTILRAIAGLERPVTGSVSIGGHVVASGSTWVPPERRGVGMVFQDGALFPHLSVSENIAFGLDRRAPRRSEQVTELLAMVDLSGLGDRRPDTLSGGQRQRVALARALAPEPSVLLFDEPFSALDASLRHRVRADVNQILRDIGVTSIFVTHDQDEAFALGDQVAVLRDSHIEQVGSPSQLYRDPITPWVAGFVGEANLLDVQASAGLVTTPFGAMALREPYDGPVTALVRPEHLKAAPGDDAEVEDLEFYGHDARYDLRFADGTMLSLRSADVEPLSRGDRVTVVYNGPPAVAWPISER